MGYPALPSSVDRYVRQMLETMAGRTGNMGDKVVTLNDLANSGLLVAIPGALNSQSNPNKNINDALTNTSQETDDSGNVVTPETETADPPTTPTGLKTTSTFGAIVLAWEAPGYAGHAYTEVYRAQFDDPDQSNVVHQETINFYTDVTGNTTPYYYWIRHVNSDGQKSQFNQVAGVSGVGNAVVSVNDLILTHPEIIEQPFTVINRGTDDEPDWAIALNGDVAINGGVNISQLESGELKNGTALTVGKSSIELSTATDGTGQLIIAGEGGIQNNDYMILNAGRISAYVFVAGIGHIPYKQVNRVETGTANSGQQVKIPGYFFSQPTIHLYPRDLSVYNANYPNQSQKLVMNNSAPQPDVTEEGKWLFTPYARLVLAAGRESVSPGWTYTGSSNSQEWTATAIENLKSVTISTRCASYRRTSGTTHQNRSVTVYLDYRTNGNSSWISADSETVNIDKFNTYSTELNHSLNQGSYDIRVRFVAADRSGTFIDGSPSYNYTSQGKTGTTWSKTVEPTSYSQTQTQFISINSHAVSGWEITRIDYSAIVDITLKVRNLYDDNWSFGEVFKGKARVRIPNGSEGHSTFEKTTSINTIEIGNPWEESSYTNQPISWSDVSYKDGNIHPSVELYGNMAGYTSKSSSASRIPSSYAYIHVKSISATVHYRQQVSTPITVNKFYVDSAGYDKGETDVSMDSAVINWMATSDS